MKNKLVRAIAVVALIVVAGSLVFGGRSYKKTVNMYMKASFEGDATTIFSLISSKMFDYGLEESGYERSDKRQIIKDTKESMKKDIERMESQTGIKWKDIKKSYKITSVEKIKGYELDDLKDRYQEAGVKISAAKFVEVEVNIQTGETEGTNTIDLYLVKIGKSWYLEPESMGSVY